MCEKHGRPWKPQKNRFDEKPRNRRLTKEIGTSSLIRQQTFWIAMSTDDKHLKKILLNVQVKVVGCHARPYIKSKKKL